MAWLRKQLLMTLLAAAFIGTAPAAAQEEPAGGAPSAAEEVEDNADTSEDATNAAAAGTARKLSPISVTATRNPIEVFDYPGMVTVVGEEDMRTLQPSTPDDVLRQVPGVEFVGGPRRTGEVPSIRGFSGPDVVVLIDGARQNFNSGHDGRFFVDPSLLVGAEVLRGSASSLYGSGGTGGVISFRTARADDYLYEDDTAGVTFFTGLHTANEEFYGGATAYAQPVDGLGILGSFTKRDSGDIHLGNGTTLENSDDDIIGALGKVDYQFADFHRIEASYLRFDNTAEEPNNGQGVGGTDSVEKDIVSDTWRLAYEYSDPGNNLVDLDVTTYYTRFQADELRLDALGGGPTGELLKRDVDTIGFRVDNRSRMAVSESTNITFTYGVEAYRDLQDGESAAGDRDGVPDAESKFGGIFAQAEIAIAEPGGVIGGDLLIIPGIRVDTYATDSDIDDGNSDTAVSPRLGISYLPNDWLMVFGSYGEAFRAPTFDELYLTGVHFQIPIGPGITNRFVPNPDLKPQRTRTLEFGAGINFEDVLADNDQFRLKGSYFFIDGKDFVDLSVNQPTPFVDCNPFIPGACDGTTTSANVPHAVLWGAEVEGYYENDRLIFSLGYSEIHGENDDTGDHLGILTPPQLTTNFAVKVPEIDSLVGWRVTAATKFDEVDDPSEERDAYIVNDIYFSWTPGDRILNGLRLDLGIDNIFDENYDRVFTDSPEPGRDFKAMVSYSLTW